MRIYGIGLSLFLSWIVPSVSADLTSTESAEVSPIATPQLITTNTELKKPCHPDENCETISGQTSSIAGVTPVAHPDVFSLSQKVQTELDIVANDIDAADTTILIPAQSNAGGTLSVSAGKVLYTPPAQDLRTDSFSYKLEESGGTQSEETLVFITNPTDDPSNFSITPYLGNGVANSIDTGLNLAEGGLVLIKPLSNDASDRWYWFDTHRGTGFYFRSDHYAEFTTTAFSQFTTGGFDLSGDDLGLNTAGKLYLSLSFKEAPGFFHIASHNEPYQISTVYPHRLDAEPGMVLTKGRQVNAIGKLWHKEGPAPGSIGNFYGALQHPAFELTEYGQKSPSTNQYWLQEHPSVNSFGKEYVVYLFANAPDKGMSFTDYTGTGTNGVITTLPFRPDFMIRKTTSIWHNWMSNVFALGGDKEVNFAASSPGYIDNDEAGLTYRWTTELNDNGEIESNALNASSHQSAMNRAGQRYILMAFSEIEHPGAAKVLPANIYAKHDQYTVPPNEPSALSVMDNDVNPSGKTLKIESVRSSANADVSVYGSDRLIRYYPALDFCGPDQFTYTAWDGTTILETATVDVNVDCALLNASPTAMDDNVFVLENQGTVINVLANDSDPESQPLRVVVTNVQNGTTVHGSMAINADNTLTYTPSTTYASSVPYTDEFTYVIQDDINQDAWAFARVTVVPDNGTPSVNNDVFTVVAEQQSQLTPLENDVSATGESWSIDSVSATANAEVLIYDSKQLIRYWPAVGFCGTDQFSYNVSDGSGLTDTATIKVYVDCNNVNLPPTANQDLVVTSEGQNVVINVLGNDTDPETQPLSVVATGVQNGTVVYGSLSINQDGTVSYQASQTYNSTASYVDEFTYTISDPYRLTSWGFIRVTVNPVNDAPVAQDDIVTTPEDTPVVINVLENDSDPEGNPLTVATGSLPTNGTIIINANQTVTYTPNQDFWGVDSFSYTVSDGEHTSTAATGNITVSAVNDAPRTMPDIFTVFEDTPKVLNVLSNDMDPEGSALSVAEVTQPANGTVAINPDQTLTYTPGQNFSGSDSFTYTASDGDLLSSATSVNVTTQPVNDAPIANADSYTTGKNLAITVNVLENDSDPEGSSLTVAVVTQASHGTVVINADSSVTYSPNLDYCGTDNFTYEAHDGELNSTAGNVTITVACDVSTFGIEWQNGVSEIVVGESATLIWNIAGAVSCTSDFSSKTTPSDSDIKQFFAPDQYQYQFVCGNTTYTTSMIDVKKLGAPGNLNASLN